MTEVCRMRETSGDMRMVTSTISEQVDGHGFNTDANL